MANVRRVSMLRRRICSSIGMVGQAIELKSTISIWDITSITFKVEEENLSEGSA